MECQARKDGVKSTYPEIIVVLDVPLGVEHGGDVLSPLRGRRDRHVEHPSERRHRAKSGEREDEKVCEGDHGECGGRGRCIR